MKKRSLKKKLFTGIAVTLLALIFLLDLLIWFSPYRYHAQSGKKMVSHTVVVNKPAGEVFGYLGNSANASKWSVFVDHIVPLSNGVPDGQAGSQRRCFCNSNEKGRLWDEEITLVEKNKRRQLRIFHLVNFTMRVEGLYTEQLYEDLGGNKTKLTFTVFFKDHKPGLWEEIKISLGAYKMKRIFRENMNNVKKLVESRS